MQGTARHRHWVVLVWITVAFFLFPLTPPISQHLPFEDNALGQSADTPVFMHTEPIPAKVPVFFHKPAVLRQEYDHKHYNLLLYVVFLCFLYSKTREFLKRRLLAPLKFTSVYVISCKL